MNHNDPQQKKQPPVQAKPTLIGEILFSEGLIEQAQLQEALDSQKFDNRRLGELLIGKGWITDEQLTRVLARMYQLPFISLANCYIDHKIIGSVPGILLQTYRVLPLSLEGNQLTLATNNPLDVAALQDIQYKTGYSVKLVMACQQEIEEHLQDYFDSQHTTLTQKARPAEDAQSAPAISQVENFIRRAIKEKASDIHFEPQKDKMRVRFRIDGVLYDRDSVDKDFQRNIISRIKIMSGMDVADNRRPQDGRATFVHGDTEFDLRISTLPNIYGENLDIRLLNKKFAERTFDSLGMEPGQEEILNHLIKKPYGLILVTGPTGAGKTTTLYSMMKIMNQSTKSIITVEDPVEYELEGINQTCINNQTGYTFATSIRHILRHDPDTIMVGEIRDQETAEIAVRAALTGHLVISTMHTNSAIGAITRLLEMKIEPFLISSALIGVIAQRLVRTLCLKCKKEFTPTADVIKYMNQYEKCDDRQILSRNVGCEACNHAGFRGRTGVYEVLQITEELRPLILHSASEAVIKDKALEINYRTLPQCGMRKVIDRVTTVEDVMRNIILD